MPRNPQNPNTADTVLILEDEPMLATNIVRFLAARGFTSELTATAADAAHRLREFPVDFMLLNVNLPDCNGLEFLRAVRPFYPRLRAVAMSGHVTEEDVKLARQLGIKEILIKPFPLSKLDELLRKQRQAVQPRA